MSAYEPPQRPSQQETIARIAERYGIPPEEVKAVITDRSVVSGNPHPMTLGTLMSDNEQTKGSSMAQSSRWTPASVLLALLGILGTLALIALVIFLLRLDLGPRTEKEVVTIRDTVALPPPVLPDRPADTTAVLSEALPPPEPVQRPVVRRRRAARPVLTTSNSIEAEERLAELRAEGNAKAKIRRVARGGTTIYEVRR